MFWASSAHYNLRFFTHDCPSCEISCEKSETDFCHMFRKNGLIVRKIILWATNFSPLLCSVQVTLHVFSFNITSSINLNLSFFSQYSQVRVCHLQEFSHIRFTNIFFNSILVITDFCYMFRKNGLIERSITLWATNFSPPHVLSEFPTL